jgi:hypothetical protein
VSGLCGRLMCCLAYEQDVYVEMMKEFPKTGSMVSTPKGDGKVKELLVMRRAVKVSLGPGQMIEVPLDEVKPLARPGGQGGPAGQGNEQAAVEAEGDGADVESDEDPAELKGLED